MGKRCQRVPVARQDAVAVLSEGISFCHGVKGCTQAHRKGVWRLQTIVNLRSPIMLCFWYSANMRSLNVHFK